jgi:hypothetical protein
LSAEVLLRLAQTYKLDMAALAAGAGTDETIRLQAVLKDPMFADIDLPSLETADVTTNFPGITEALLRLYTPIGRNSSPWRTAGPSPRPPRPAAARRPPTPVAEIAAFP